MALIYVSYVDAIGACFDAKYHYGSWRPASAIQMADADGNDATAPDAARAPVLPTPDHPEYPAAHSCTSGSLGEALRAFYGTPEVTFTWDSTVTRTRAPAPASTRSTPKRGWRACTAACTSGMRSCAASRHR
jgi:hypothetical protein